MDLSKCGGICRGACKHYEIGVECPADVTYEPWEVENLYEKRQVRDKFLTEAMGGCWHEFHEETSKGCICRTCGLDLKCLNLQHANFSTWEGFGKLWEWSKTQEWWADFMSRDVDAVDFYESLIEPDHYADAIYELLAESV